MKTYNAPVFTFLECTASEDLLTVSLATGRGYGNITLWSDFIDETE